MMLHQQHSSCAASQRVPPLAHTIVLRPLAACAPSSRDAQHALGAAHRGGGALPAALGGGAGGAPTVAVRCASPAAALQQPQRQHGEQQGVQHHNDELPWAPKQLQGPVAPGHWSPVGGHKSSTVEHTASALAALTACCALVLAAPAAAHASGGGEALTGEAAQLFTQFLDKVESMGPAGAVVFVLVVMVFEMVPLFPTQPLSLASGLLFGAQKGGLLMLLGVTLAALNAFLIARGVGRPLAQRVIDAEMSHAEGGEASGAIAKTMAGVQAAIDEGGLWKQMTAVTLLRLTPVVPFSASNYLLGLTPVQLPAFVGGTITGMSVWSALYASLGGASRALLDKGADMETLLADLSGRASALSSHALGITGGLAGAAVLLLVAQKLLSSSSSSSSNTPGSDSNHPSSGGGSSSSSSNGTGDTSKLGSGAQGLGPGGGGAGGGGHLMVGPDGDAAVGSSGSGAVGVTRRGASSSSAEWGPEDDGELGSRETVSSLVGSRGQARPGERA